MDSMEGKDGTDSPRAPWGMIGVIVGMLLILPAFLYSVAPEEPLREGVVVFSNSKQRVYLAASDRYRHNGYSNYCVLEPQEQLVILRKSSDRVDRSFVARFEGKTVIQFPFCPPQAEVIVKPHQVAQKESLLQELKDSALHFLGR
jgi:hypothetical protein